MRTTLKVRFTDIDVQGHANHTAYVEWIGFARVKLIDDLVDQSGLTDIDHVLARLSVDFSAEVFYPGSVEVTGRIVHVGGRSVETEFFVHQQDRPAATAGCVNVFFDKASKKTVRIPDELRCLLEEEKHGPLFNQPG